LLLVLLICFFFVSLTLLLLLLLLLLCFKNEKCQLAAKRRAFVKPILIILKLPNLTQ